MSARIDGPPQTPIQSPAPEQPEQDDIHPAVRTGLVGGGLSMWAAGLYLTADMLGQFGDSSTAAGQAVDLILLPFAIGITFGIAYCSGKAGLAMIEAGLSGQRAGAPLEDCEE